MTTEEKHGPSNGHASNGNGQRAKRRSSLMQAAVALPTVESSLEEFIARANSTLVDVDQWEAEARAEKERQAREQTDAEQQRISRAEQVVRDEATRERGSLQSRINQLEHDLADAQSRRAELEAKVAVLSSDNGHASAVADLEGRLAAAESQRKNAEERIRLAEGRAAAAESRASQASVAAVPASLAPAAAADADAGRRLAAAEERARIAEGKASKAVAAARAAAAGLTVNPADLDKIEAGIGIHAAAAPAFARDLDDEPVVAPRRGLPLGAVIAAFVGGVAVMLVGVKLLGSGDKTTPAPTQLPAAAGVVQQQPAVQPAAGTNVQPSAAVVQPTTAQPTVVEPAVVQPTTVEPTTAQPTTIEPATTEPAAGSAAAAVTTEAPKPADAVRVEPTVAVEQPKATQPKATQPKATQPKATQPKATQPKVTSEKPKTTKPAAGGIVDPFGAPAPAEKPVNRRSGDKPKAKKTEDKKPAGGIVDPFAS